jgi:hypothetical protein
LCINCDFCTNAAAADTRPPLSSRWPPCPAPRAGPPREGRGGGGVIPPAQPGEPLSSRRIVPDRQAWSG